MKTPHKNLSVNRHGREWMLVASKIALPYLFAFAAVAVGG